jgi:hypothetical protein
MNKGKCLTCEIEFQKKAPNQDYCTPECRPSFSEPKTKNCITCGKEIKATNKYCDNLECRPNTKECIGCKKTYISWSATINFCSLSCKKKNTNTAVCKNCGISCRSALTHCSKECKTEYKKNNPRAPKPKPVAKKPRREPEQKLCYYCNEPANSVEHVIPQCVMMNSPTIPACLECNIFIGSYLGSLDEKIIYLKRQLKKHYAKELALPSGDPNKERIINRLLHIPNPLDSVKDYQTIYSPYNVPEKWKHTN